MLKSTLLQVNHTIRLNGDKALANDAAIKGGVDRSKHPRPAGAQIDSRMNNEVGNVIGFDVQANTKVRLLGDRK